MTNLLHAWVAAMLVCVPISLIFVVIDFVFRYGNGEKLKQGGAWAVWFNVYVIVAVCQTAVFAGVAGIMMLLGAFR
jgi:K+ transporter